MPPGVTQTEREFLMDVSAEKTRSHAARVTGLTCRAEDVLCICQEELPSGTEHCWRPRLSLGTCSYLRLAGLGGRGDLLHGNVATMRSWASNRSRGSVADGFTLGTLVDFFP